MLRRPLLFLAAFYNSEWRKFKIFLHFYNNVNFYLVTKIMYHAQRTKTKNWTLEERDIATNIGGNILWYVSKPLCWLFVTANRENSKISLLFFYDNVTFYLVTRKINIQYTIAQIKM